MDPVLFGLSASVLTVLTVQGIKKLVPALKPHAAWVALVTALFWVALALVMEVAPESARYVGAVVSAAVVWLMSIGIYEKSKDAKKLVGE
jgi:hypothetical protein